MGDIRSTDVDVRCFYVYEPRHDNLHLFPNRPVGLVKKHGKL